MLETYPKLYDVNEMTPFINGNKNVKKTKE